MKKLAVIVLALILVCGAIPMGMASAEGDNYVHIIGRNLGSAVDDNNEILQELCKRTGLDIHWELWPTTDYAQNVQIMIAGGEYPDGMEIWWNSYPTEFNNLIEDGLIAPLEDLLDAYGQNIANTRSPESYYDSRDGHKWGVSCRVLEDGNTYCVMMRKDWLDKLDLEIPTNWSEYAACIKAFRDNAELLTGDPNGFAGHGGCTNYFLNCLGEYILSEFGMTRGWNEVDGKMVYHINMPGYKDALLALRTMMLDGLIDPESMIQGRDAWLDKWNNNNYGGWDFTTDCLDRNTNAWMNDYQTANPEADIIVLAPFRDAEGNGHLRTVNQTQQFVVFENSEHKENVIKLLDYLATEEGMLLVNYGIEGKHWVMGENGIPVSIIAEDADLAAIGSASYDWVHRVSYFALDFSKEFDAARQSIKECVIPTPVMPTTESYADNKSSLDYIYTTYRAELLTNPAIDFDAVFDQFVEEWNTAGGEEWTEEINAYWFGK